MKSKNILLLLLFLFINFSVGFICYFYPISRDEFYYLESQNTPNVFLEYYNSYFYVNPRIGQFFSNLVGRNSFFEVVFGLALFHSFFTVLFLNIFRRLPKFSQKKDLNLYFFCIAVFIILINYFGEMFFYVPFSTNYTFLQIFYLLYIFLMMEYFIYGNNILEYKKIPILLVIIFGIFVGMGNEHVPPILILFSFLTAFFYWLKNKKLPYYKVVLLPISMVIGYLLLFFAPANTIKEKTVHKNIMDTTFSDYIHNLTTIAKLYYYYNFEIVIATICVFIFMFYFRKKVKNRNKNDKTKLLVFFLLSISAFVIIGLSPLSGTRILFFTNTGIIIVLLILFSASINKKSKEISIFSQVFLLCFFTIGCTIVYHANANFRSIFNEIESQKKSTNQVVIKQSFHYYLEGIPYNINRKILLDSGVDYIDINPLKDNSVERNIKIHFHLQSIQTKK